MPIEKKPESTTAGEGLDAVLQKLIRDNPAVAMELIAKLKSHGFKWAPSKMAWQRQLTSNALYSLKSVLSA